MNVIGEDLSAGLTPEKAAEIGSELEHSGPTVLAAFAKLHSFSKYKLARTLSLYAANLGVAKTCRLRGRIADALKFEANAERMYRALPANARW